jgi:hypothetical protein
MTKEELAKKFSKLLCDEIGKFKVCRVNKRNSKETNSQICHSHDFCDANQVMIDAAELSEAELNDIDNLWEHFGEAWTLAKQNQFYLGD